LSDSNWKTWTIGNGRVNATELSCKGLYAGQYWLGIPSGKRKVIKKFAKVAKNSLTTTFQTKEKDDKTERDVRMGMLAQN
jgi:hypothetical protein